jgi:hypothetical protein
LPIILCGCETGALNPKESTNWRVFEKSDVEIIWNRSKVLLHETTDPKKKNLKNGSVEQRDRQTSEQRIIGTKNYNKISKGINRERTVRNKRRPEPTNQNKKRNLTKSIIKQRERGSSKQMSTGTNKP